MQETTMTYYDQYGNPTSHENWLVLRNDEQAIRVAEDTVGEYWVSTVWLGLDHALEGYPVLWETMIFGNGTSDPLKLHDWQDRYISREAAVEGHKRVVYNIKNALRFDI